MPFEVVREVPGSEARLGCLRTAHGAVETPTFVAVATRGAVRAVAMEDLEALGVQILIANTYHLAVRPGPELVAELGGLHGFTGWRGPWMTDSGGFQVFSLGAGKVHGVGKIASIFPGEDRPRRDPAGVSLVELTEEGVWIRSVLDGRRLFFSPEEVIRIERLLGADIVLPLDECTSPFHDEAYTRRAMERTHRWAERALSAFEGTRGLGPNPHQELWGIVQGGAYEELRRASARTIAGLGFPGFAIGGSLGRSKEDMYRVLEWTVPELPRDKPRHLLGIGTLEDIVEAVRRGMDLFDCAAPTRLARNGALLALSEPGFRLNIDNARFRRDERPVDEACDCPTCRRYSRAFLHHLLRAGELAYFRLATVHNLRFMVRFMGWIRAELAAGRLPELPR
ncbi:MAG: tRNA guanosine(34) transglycosylase Tgt [Candidatus Bipolaricaulota bacterium]|nr:tRNA guanosine(34) transglycosylase Tgt [Candidatus Bipolaricaulota bacterium]MCX7843922.1 tRNA guanosine(34) transglycosylase Tgt [Candidatus Bipolaricaulota bacterium]MDW8151670.1 tRNA guanosine(34) transglycosylase Tgt [Candidatus Bipolaricaulota bacterium]